MIRSSFLFMFTMIPVLTFANSEGDIVTTTNNVVIDDNYSLNALKKIRFNQLLIDAKATQAEEIKDPLQPLNRKIYAFNNVLDQNILRPVAVQYQQKVPEEVRGGYRNFRQNLYEPWNAINQLLQGKPKTAAKTLGRFTINTFTSLGFADTAKRKNLTIEKDDFSDTLGVWGVKSGPYIIIPFLGPSTFRDSAGLTVDLFARPQRYVFIDDKILWTENTLEIISFREELLAVDSLLKGDQYSALRDAYLQQRAFTIANKRGENTAENMFSDSVFTDDEFISEEPITDEEPIDETDSSEDTQTTPQ